MLDESFWNDPTQTPQGQEPDFPFWLQLLNMGPQPGSDRSREDMFAYWERRKQLVAGVDPQWKRDNAHVLTDEQWALLCPDIAKDPWACHDCGGCHRERCNRDTSEMFGLAPDGSFKVLSPGKTSICEGPPGHKHRETLVPAGDRCSVCGLTGLEGFR